MNKINLIRSIKLYASLHDSKYYRGVSVFLERCFIKKGNQYFQAVTSSYNQNSTQKSNSLQFYSLHAYSIPLFIKEDEQRGNLKTENWFI